MKGKLREWKIWMLRVLFYFAGMWMISAGIVLCVKSDLGVSPISSMPYVLSISFSLTFGTYTMLFHYVNTIFQYIMEKRLWNPQIFLQIPIAFAFGWTIDLLKNSFTFSVTTLGIQILCLLFSIFFTAFGMVFMVNMQLVQNPPDGTVRVISEKYHKDLGRVKITYDCFMTILSIFLSMILLGRVEGFGAATIFSAVFVGRTLSVLQKYIGQKLRNIFL